MSIAEGGVEAPDCITTGGQKDRRDRDIAEAVGEGCARAGGNSGCCQQRATAGPDAHDMRRIQSIVILIPETELGHGTELLKVNA